MLESGLSKRISKISKKSSDLKLFKAKGSIATSFNPRLSSIKGIISYLTSPNQSCKDETSLTMGANPWLKIGIKNSFGVIF
ncbi:MAG: hypothetical protein COA32_09945 [Fluviicola sp.]|nr:MAG: hypothetical protein COA32_09945 [Fluviicola sp.]